MILLHDAGAGLWNLYHEPVSTYSLFHLDQVIPTLEEIQERVEEEELFAAGFISYEAAGAFDPALKTHSAKKGLPILHFSLYRFYRRGALSRLWPYKDKGIPPLPWKPAINRGEYSEGFQRIKRALKEGDSYQINYTFPLEAHQKESPRDYFPQLIRNQNPQYGAFIEEGDFTILSLSPELFFSRDNNTLHCRPMKGTAPRKPDQAQDLAQVNWLKDSEKNRAENLMIVDMIRNDLGRVCSQVKTTSLFEVETYPTVHQMVSRIEGSSPGGLVEHLKALFPCASITGAPKVRTMELIKEVEPHPRGIYTGAIGFYHPEGHTQFNVPIRTLLWQKGTQKMEYNVGGGIVWDSQEEEEYQEALLKSLVLRRKTPSFSLLESLLWTPEKGYWLKDRHLDRLQGTAAYFGYPFRRVALETRLDKMLRTFDTPESRKIRLLLSPRGGITLEAALLRDKGGEKTYRLGPDPVDPEDPFLYHKTTNRQVYKDRSLEGCYDTLLQNTRGELTEFTTGNLVVQKGNRYLTPPLSSGLLGGTLRRQLLEEGKIMEQFLTPRDLGEADQVFLINSVRGWIPLEEAQ